MFRSDAPNYSIGVTISFPFRNKTAKANLAGAKVQQEQLDAQKDTAGTDRCGGSPKCCSGSRDGPAADHDRTHGKRKMLRSNSKASENFMNAGKSTTFLLFQRENTLTNARNAEIRAETDYNKALSDLQRVMSTTFQVNNIEVESPTN